MTCQWWLGQTNPHLTCYGQQSPNHIPPLLTGSTENTYNDSLWCVHCHVTDFHSISYHTFTQRVNQWADPSCLQSQCTIQSAHIFAVDNLGLNPSHISIKSLTYTDCGSPHVYDLVEHTLHALENTSWLLCLVVHALSTSVGHYTSDRLTNTQQHAHRHIVHLTHFDHIQHSIDK